MKLATVMMALTVALAFATSGCRYGKANGADSLGTTADDGSMNTTEIATETDIEEGTIDDISTAGKNFEDLYTPCTDVSFTPVYFGFDSTIIPQGELEKVEAVAAHLADKTDRVVVIEGHCDDRGSNEYNMSLGENRAIIIRNYLLESGVTEDRIQTRSYGEERPSILGSDEGAWSKNRRGEFVIFQK